MFFNRNWKSLGDVEDKIFYFEDSIIPDIYRENIWNMGVWLKLDDGIYYFKMKRRDKIITELLGEKISEYFGLPTVHYTLAKCEKGKQAYYGLLSKWARLEDWKYTTVSYELLQKGYSTLQNLEILLAIDKEWKGQKIAKQIRNFLVRDYFTNDWDRVSDELLVKKKKNEVELGYLSDYEVEFKVSKRKIAISGLYDLNLQDDETIDWIQNDEELLKRFQKSLEISLRDLLRQLQEEKQLRISDDEIKKYTDFETFQKNKIQTRLSL